MLGKTERLVRKWLWFTEGTYTVIHLKRLVKTTINLYSCTQCPGHDLNWPCPEIKREVLLF
jgi:hypothetical protein